MAWDALGAVAKPTRISNNRELPDPGEFRYVDWRNHSLYLTNLSGPLTMAKVRKARLRMPLNQTNIYYGPIELPLPQDEALVAAYAHPFHVGDATVDVTRTDSPICRPIVALRGEHDIEIALGSQKLRVITGFQSNTGIDPVPDDVRAEHMVGDFFADINASTQGLPASSVQQTARVAYVSDEGADADNPGNNIYQIMYTSGHRTRVSLTTGTQPAAGSVYPSNQEATQFDFLVGEQQWKQSRMYPLRNMRAVPNRSGDLIARVPEEVDPHTIVKVRTQYDYPNNPTTLIKVITLADGTTVTRSSSTAAVVGQKIGEATGTGSLYTSLDIDYWVEFDLYLVTLESKGDDTLAGMAVDPWPLPE